MDLASQLEAFGPEGVFLRFLRALTGRDDLFQQQGRAVAGGGAPARVFVVFQHWVLGEGEADARDLLAATLTDARVRAVYYAAEGTAGPLPPGWSCTRDLMLQGPAPASPLEEDSDLVSEEAFFDAQDILHPELLPLLPPPPLRSSLPFRFHGLVSGGQIVSICDTTVDDGQWAVLQQVRTPSSLRGQGLARRLVPAVLRWLGARGRRALWVCDEQNLASVATARSAGLELYRELPLLQRT